MNYTVVYGLCFRVGFDFMYTAKDVGNLISKMYDECGSGSDEESKFVAVLKEYEVYSYIIDEENMLGLVGTLNAYLAPRDIDELYKDLIDCLSEDEEYYTAEDVQDILFNELSSANFKVETFKEAGVMTNNKGIVLYMNDGQEFQIEINGSF